MFNLLPEPEKKQIIDEYHSRRTVVGLSLLFVVGLISIVAIFPSFVLSGSKVSDAENTINNLKDSSIFKEEAGLNSELSQANAKLVALHPAKSDVDVAGLFQSIVTHKTNNIRITGFLYTPTNATNPGKISIQGLARGREDLSLFVDSLKKDPSYKSVDLPVSSFTKDLNADFSIDITGNF